MSKWTPKLLSSSRLGFPFTDEGASPATPAPKSTSGAPATTLILTLPGADKDVRLFGAAVHAADCGRNWQLALGLKQEAWDSLGILLSTH